MGNTAWLLLENSSMERNPRGNIAKNFPLVCRQNGGVFVVPNQSKVRGANVGTDPDNLHLSGCYPFTTQIRVLPILFCMGHDFIVPNSQVPKKHSMIFFFTPFFLSFWQKQSARDLCTGVKIKVPITVIEHCCVILLGNMQR